MSQPQASIVLKKTKAMEKWLKKENKEMKQKNYLTVRSYIKDNRL